MNNIPFESWFKREANNEKICFLCGIDLDRNNTSREHVFPKWILNEFDLWNTKIRLLNQTYFNYRSATIPCCKKCNNEYLSKLEEEISNGINKGFDFFSKNIALPAIYKWCQLLFYKIVYKENFLKENIKNPNSEKIVKEEQFRFMQMNHLLLRSIDKKITFSNFFPGSIFVCNLKTSKAERHLNFDFIDSVPEQCLSIRINDVGIIAILADSNLQTILKQEEYKDYLNHVLSPIQFRNFFAKCLYQQKLFNDPFIFMISDVTEESLKLTLEKRPNFNSENVYETGDPNDYIQLLGLAFDCDPELFRLKNGMPGSFFYDKDGNWDDRDFDDPGWVYEKK